MASLFCYAPWALGHAKNGTSQFKKEYGFSGDETLLEHSLHGNSEVFAGIERLFVY